MEYNGGNMTNTRVLLDGNLYKNVVFTNCKMVFSGAETREEMGIVGCKFINCEWHFEGQAAHTIKFLNSLGASLGPSGKKLIKNIFKIKD